MRKLELQIFRFNPQEPKREPRLQKFMLDETPRMTLYTALTKIQEEQDGSLRFDFVCRSAFCGSCGMIVNGKPRLACHTRTEELPETITLFPMPFFQLIGDLSVDTGKWFREMGRRVQSWIHSPDGFDAGAEEERMSNRQAQAIYELDRCIECGLCVAACATAQMRGDFLGAAGFARIGRFLLDPRDRRSDAEVFEIVGGDDGVFGCIGLLACADTCPKQLPLASQMAYLRRRFALASFNSLAR